MKRIIRIMIITLALCLLVAVSCLRGCFLGQTQRFTSPSGEIKIIVKYDFVSRPTVFVDGFLFDREIWSYSDTGFMETVYFQPEWISETEFIFRYDDPIDQYDEEYHIRVD